MIGLVILYFIAKWLYNLAKTHNKANAWLYGVLAIVTYYGISILAGVIIAIMLIAADSNMLETTSGELIISLIAIPFGVGGVALLHYLLKRSWSKQESPEDQILDDSLSEL
jgi:hypothetical protein